MKQLISKFLVAFLLTSAVVLSWSEYFFVFGKCTKNFFQIGNLKFSCQKFANQLQKGHRRLPGLKNELQISVRHVLNFYQIFEE